jgi:aryl-alcohol dehydrogenase-like predicted oxidoreductase
MQFSRLGQSVLEVSKIGFGCMSLKGDAAANELLFQRALDLGVNYFDTADLYDNGRNEEIVGALVKPVRAQVVLATKVGNQMRPDGSGWDWNPGKDYIMSAVEASLRRLQTDYIDLYQLHGGTMDDPMDETIEAFERLKEQGKIRYYGISSIRPNVIREYVQRSEIVNVMMQYSLLDRRPEEESLELLRKNGVSVVSRGAVAQGLLADKPAKEYLGWLAPQVAQAAEAIRQVTPEGGSPAQTAIQFVLQHQAIASAVVGIRTISQLQDAVAAINLTALPVDSIQLLYAAAPAQLYTDHR